MKATYSSLLTATVASLALLGCHRDGSDNLAVVNGEAITMDEFHRYLERKPAVTVTFPQAGQVQAGQAAELPIQGSLGFQALRDLVNRRILLQVAKDKGVFPSDAEVAKELDFQKKSRPTFVSDLVAKGMTLEDIRHDLTLDIAKEHIVTKGITVKPEEADKYIKDNPSEFEIPQQARLRFLIVKDDATKKLVDRDIAAGVPFGTVAQTYSTVPSARTDQGAYTQTSNVPAMPSFLQDLVGKTAERGVSPWLGLEGQWVKISVEQKVPAKKVEVTDVIKENVRRRIALQRGSEATDLGKQLVEKLQTAKIEVMPPSLKAPWDQAWKTLTETDVQSKTRTGAPGAAGTTAGAPKPTTTAGKLAPN